MARRLVGPSVAMKKLRFDLWNNVFTHNIDFYEKHLLNRMEDFSTLILGETGTGKGTAAMAIGCSGFIPFHLKKKGFQESFTKSFVSINLSQFPETLIESELFGHKKGAFTGAAKDHTGVFGRCSPYGAILLDEIGETSTQLQIKLLEVLQNRVFSPVGSHEKSRFEGRVIAATNRAIDDIREKNIFRDDFYYRLSSDIITVPPLRERIRQNPDELDDLLSYTIERMLGRPSPELKISILAIIEKNLGPEYAWPGNVRELEQCVRRVILTQNYEGDIKSVSPDDLKARLVKGMESGELDAQHLLAGYCTLLYKRYGTFEDVARRTNLDRRTVKKYIDWWEKV
jgi:transcriptional regulator with GAF, ATPase, and Fis domain